MLNLRVNREEYLKVVRKVLTGEMEKEIKSISEDGSLDTYEKSNKIIKTISIYENIYCIFFNSILKFFIQFLKKFSKTGLFLSSQNRKKFKIYNLN